MRRWALVGAGCGAGLLFLTWLLALHAGAVQHADESLYVRFRDLQRPGLTATALAIAKLSNPQPYVYLAAVPVLVALGTRRPRVALAVVAILVGANGTTRLLKPLLAHSRAGSVLGGVSTLAPNSWPSGHTTAVVSLALSSVVAVPGRLRVAAVSLAVAFGLAASASFVILGWHYPSDVIGGWLVAITWTLLAVAALVAADRRWPRRPAARPVFSGTSPAPTGAPRRGWRRG